jgi:hypothetical protein
MLWSAKNLKQVKKNELRTISIIKFKKNQSFLQKVLPLFYSQRGCFHSTAAPPNISIAAPLCFSPEIY